MNSPIVYLELPAPDIEKAGSFYSKIFGWKIEQSSLSDQDYWMFHSGENSLAGGLDSTKMPAQDGGPIIYIKTDDIHLSLDEINKFGGETVREKFDIGGGFGFSAIFRDPNGNELGLWSQT